MTAAQTPRKAQSASKKTAKKAAGTRKRAPRAKGRGPTLHPPPPPDPPMVNVDGAEVPPVTGVVVPFERPRELLPVVPSSNEFETLAQMAQVMASSQIVPKALQGKPHDVFLVLWTARDLGIPITSGLREVHVIDGQPSISPKLRMARIRQLGLGRIITDPLTVKPICEQPDEEVATVIALGNDKCVPCDGAGWLVGADGPMHCPACHTTGRRLMGPPMSYSWADACDAGMVRADCKPHEHSDDCREAAKATGSDGKPNYARRRTACKHNYVTYPDRMLAWRASGYLADDVFPEASMGLYSPDELGALTNDDGEIIDIDSVDVPKGYERKAPPPTPGTTLIDPETHWALQVRIASLPEDPTQVELRHNWVRAGLPGLYNPAMTMAHHKTISALIAGLERGLERRDWNREEEEQSTLSGVALVIGPLVEFMAGAQPSPVVDLVAEGYTDPEPSEAPGAPVVEDPPEPPDAQDSAPTAATGDGEPEASDPPAEPQATATEPPADVPSRNETGLTPEQLSATPPTWIPEAAVTAIIGRCQAMTRPELVSDLESLGLDAFGHIGDLRMRFGAALLNMWAADNAADPARSGDE